MKEISGEIKKPFIVWAICLSLFILLILIGEKILPILLGVILIFLGIGIIFDPKFYSYKFDYYFDFSGYNIPFGIFMMVVGVLFIWTTFKRKAKT